MHRVVNEEDFIATELEEELKPKRKRGRKRKTKINAETNTKKLRKKRKCVDKIETEILEDLKEEDGTIYSDNEFK